MANNDMEVIIYKISSHLYESIKLWHKTCLNDIACRYKLFDTLEVNGNVLITICQDIKVCLYFEEAFNLNYSG